MLCFRLGLALATGVLVVGPAAAQIQGGAVGRYEAIYGRPVNVSVDDLLRGDFGHDGGSVRTTGRLDYGNTGNERVFALAGSFGGRLLILPVSEVAFDFDSLARTWLGGQVEVTGVFHGSRTGSSRPYIQFWSFSGPPDPEEKGPLKAGETTLEALVLRPGSQDGRMLRVVGKFRGRNLYGDLPIRSARRRQDWVIKDDLFAVWVTEKKPKGKGWELDPTLKRDTSKWIEVVGRPETIDGITYIKAVRVALSAAPRPAAQVQAAPAPPERPKVPPVIVFALPLDGEEVPPGSRFAVQFSKDMEMSSFQGRVVLRYAGPRQPGDRAFDGLSLKYDGGRRALWVDPGDLLRAGRQVEILLLPGIKDIDGLTLEPRPGKDEPSVIDALRYYVET
jgi:hypothetical protein